MARIVPVNRIRLSSMTVAGGVSGSITGSGGVSLSAITVAGTGVAGSFETTFDALYSGFTPISGTTYYSRPTETKPSDVAPNLSTPSYTDQRFNTKIFRVSNVADAPDTITTFRHEYSRRQAYNADSSRFIIQSSNGFWYLINSSTNEIIPGGRTSTPGNGALLGFAGDCEPIWHPTDPTKIWYTAINGGASFSEFDTTTNSSTTLFTFVGRSWAGGTLGSSMRIWWQGEGRPSNDGRYWGMSVQDSAFNQLGLLMYDRQADSIIGSIETTNKPNNVTTSSTGAYVVPGWANGEAITFATAAGRPIDTTNGDRAYTPDFASFQQLSSYNEHGDTCIDALGNDVIVKVTYSGGGGGRDPDVTDGYVYYRRMDNGVAYDLVPSYQPTGATSYAWHMSGHGTNRPGWVVLGSYAGGAGATWKDEVIIVAELVPSGGRQYRVAHHQSVYTDFFSEPHATCNKDLTRIHFTSNFGGTDNEDYMVGLPSDWLPTAGS